MKEAMRTAEKGLKVIIADGECMLVRQRRIRIADAEKLKRGECVGDVVDDDDLAIRAEDALIGTSELHVIVDEKKSGDGRSHWTSSSSLGAPDHGTAVGRITPGG